MPTYEYACRSCGEHLEVVQAFTDATLTECPKCGGPLRKVFGNVGISFKGDGFYRTDSRKTSSGSSRSERSEKSEGDAKVAANGTGGEATQSKPAEKSGATTGDSAGVTTGSKSASKPSTPSPSAS